MTEKMLSYNLDVNEDYVNFQIVFQNPKVDKFFSLLKKIGKKEFMTSNGTRIRQSLRPEWRQSQKIIFLRGKDSASDYRVDVTNFANKSYVKRSIKEFDSAMREFADAVRYADKQGLLNLSSWNTYSFIGGVKVVNYPSAVDYFLCKPVSISKPSTVKAYNI